MVNNMINAVKDFKMALKERLNDLEKKIDDKIKDEMRNGFTIMTMRLTKHEDELFTTKLMKEYENNGFEISLRWPGHSDFSNERLLIIKWKELEEDEQHA